MQAMTSCTPNPRNCGGTGGCEGATAELAYDMVKAAGLPFDSAFPYSSGNNGETGKCTKANMNGPRISIRGYRVLPSNQYLPLKQALVQQGHAIAVAVDATNWNFYFSGI